MRVAWRVVRYPVPPAPLKNPLQCATVSSTPGGQSPGAGAPPPGGTKYRADPPSPHIGAEIPTS